MEIKNIFKKMSAQKAQHEALVSMDFKLDTEKNALIRLCLSSFANWPIAIIFIVFYLNPFRYQYSLSLFFEADSRLMIWAYSQNFLLGFLVFAVLATFVSFEILWLSVVGWLISNGDVHLLIAIGAVTGVFFASARKNLKLIVLLQGQIKKTWTYFSVLQVFSVFISASINYIFYINLKNFGFFTATTRINRFEFFIWVVVMNYVTQILVLAFWGHLYARRKATPVSLKDSDRNEKILTKLNLSRDFKNKLKLSENSLKI